jgi:MoaD family protein
MNIVRIPTPLRTYTSGEKEIQISADTVGGAMQALANQHPSLRAHLFDEQEQLRPYVNVFLNDEDVRNLDGAQTPIREGDRLMIVPSIAGGSFQRSG